MDNRRYFFISFWVTLENKSSIISSSGFIQNSKKHPTRKELEEKQTDLILRQYGIKPSKIHLISISEFKCRKDYLNFLEVSDFHPFSEN
ncbi:hypothetical protein LV89_03831 [Arcicella aurantiaca]|uniref:Uncharacterized protein n=1 Tax=Arcicella aurantiaca TaxID=591202 RepID=A0A316DS30_9BACT|nr:hypothetical protein [Arcicella aurantiaca]PWK20288.1 hypothetical protein LV89_03831 [Arcicella aurantiaca]